MDIQRIAANAAAVAFKTAGDVLKDVQLQLASRVQPDVTNDNPDPAFDAPVYNVQALKFQTREQRVAEDAAKTSAFLVRTEELRSQGFGPEEELSDGDQVIEGTVTWVVYRADPDPAGATWTLQTRR